MGEHFDLSFCDLRTKEIINTYDGSRLGRIIDIIFSATTGEVKGIVVPYCRRLFFARNQEIFIPWKCINKIGEDVILVCLIDDGFVGQPGRGRRRRHDQMRELRAAEQPHHDGGFKDSGRGGGHNKHGSFNIHSVDNDKKCNTNSHLDCDNDADCSDDCNHSAMPNCDRKCEKCMLFDCEYRWKLD